MGCKLSIHVANPQEEALETEVAALRQTVLDLRTVVRALAQTKKSDTLPAKENVVADNHIKGNNKKTESLSQVTSSTEEHVVFVARTADAFLAQPSVELRVPLKPTEIVAHLLRAAHKAEINALDYFITNGDTSNNDTQVSAVGWEEYQSFRRQYGRLLYGGKDEEDGGGLLHFLGLSRDLLAMDEECNQAEAADIKAIEESLDWRDNPKDVLIRYRDARLAHVERVEDDVLPRLEALQAAAADDTESRELEEMTRGVLTEHVLRPLAADARHLESFVRYVTRHLERHGPNKSAIRPFQNAIKAMAQTAEQADLYKSWITNTRRYGVLVEEKAAKEKTAAQPVPDKELTVEEVPKEAPPEQPLAAATAAAF